MRLLEDKHNIMINQLHDTLNSISRAPPITQVEDVKQFIQDEGKTIRWNLDKIEQKNGRQWKRKLAKRQHMELKNGAKDLIVQQRQRLKQIRKWEARNNRRRDGPTIVMDSGATSTCIKSSDAQHVKVLPDRSSKVFLNANGTQSPAGYKAMLYHNLRAPANQADLVPTLSTNSLLSTSKLADANYVTVFTNRMRYKSSMPKRQDSTLKDKR
jgi:hypothetical protein